MEFRDITLSRKINTLEKTIIYGATRIIYQLRTGNQNL